MLFILSTERSGSTLLSMALGAHERHITPPEMHLFSYASYGEWRREYPSAMLSLQSLLRACGSDENDSEVDRRFANRTPEETYRWILENRLPPGAHFIDKTPKYGRDPDVLERIERLRPRYIWLVRHPLGVAVSQIALRRARRAQKANGWLARTKDGLSSIRDALLKRRLIAREVGYWREVNANIETFLSRVDPSRWKRVNFESFVRNPEAMLREVCDWLGSEFRPAMLTPGENIPREMRPELGDPKIYRRKRIDPAVADEWRAHVSEAVLDEETVRCVRRWGMTRE